MKIQIDKKLARHNELKLCLQDINEGLFSPSVWFYMAWQDIKQRYRRSTIGPFWITISTGAMLLAMGPLYGKLFNQEIGPYFQYVTVSFVVWMLISGFINESCTTFIGAENIIKNIKMPLVIHLLRVLAKNLMMFGHNSLFVFVVLCFFPPERMNVTILALIGLFLVLVNLFWIGLILAIVCTRFRDVTQIISSLVQVAFFMTPIMWKVDMLGKHHYVADWNFLYHLIEVVRAPVLGQIPSQLSWWVVSVGAVVGSVAALVFFSRFRSRIAYWL